MPIAFFSPLLIRFFFLLIFLENVATLICRKVRGHLDPFVWCRSEEGRGGDNACFVFGVEAGWTRSLPLSLCCYLIVCLVGRFGTYSFRGVVCTVLCSVRVCVDVRLVFLDRVSMT